VQRLYEQQRQHAQQGQSAHVRAQQPKQQHNRPPQQQATAPVVPQATQLTDTTQPPPAKRPKHGNGTGGGDELSALQGLLGKGMAANMEANMRASQKDGPAMHTASAGLQKRVRTDTVAAARAVAAEALAAASSGSEQPGVGGVHSTASGAGGSGSGGPLPPLKASISVGPSQAPAQQRAPSAHRQQQQQKPASSIAGSQRELKQRAPAQPQPQAPAQPSASEITSPQRGKLPREQARPAQSGMNGVRPNVAGSMANGGGSRGVGVIGAQQGPAGQVQDWGDALEDVVRRIKPSPRAPQNNRTATAHGSTEQHMAETAPAPSNAAAEQVQRQPSGSQKAGAKRPGDSNMGSRPENGGMKRKAGSQAAAGAHPAAGSRAAAPGGAVAYTQRPQHSPEVTAGGRQGNDAVVAPRRSSIEMIDLTQDGDESD
jgi:hypothetical protein